MPIESSDRAFCDAGSAVPPAPTFVSWRVSAVEGAVAAHAASIRSALRRRAVVVNQNDRSGHAGKVGAGGTAGGVMDLPGIRPLRPFGTNMLYGSNEAGC